MGNEKPLQKQLNFCTITRTNLSFFYFYYESISFQIHNHEFVEVCMKILYQVELHRTTLEQMWGFSVEAELIENAERQDELCCYVSRVEDKSVAMHNGK